MLIEILEGEHRGKQFEARQSLSDRNIINVLCDKPFAIERKFVKIIQRVSVPIENQVASTVPIRIIISAKGAIEWQ